MKRITAYSPAHTTGLFFIHDIAEEVSRKGSLGAGFSIDYGVYSTIVSKEAEERLPAEEKLQAEQNDTSSNTQPAPSRRPSYLVNGIDVKPHEVPVSQTVFQRYLELVPDFEEKRLSVEQRIDPPQGSGFGTSGAGALSLSLALNAALDYPLSDIETAGIAHEAEVLNRTGLGTVIGEYYGGGEIRTEAGAPGYGKIEPFAVSAALKAVFTVFGPYSTKSALSDAAIRRRINTYGKRFYDELLAGPTLEAFLSLSREFARKTGLMTERSSRVVDFLENEGYVASMLMFGDAVFTLLEEGKAKEIEYILTSRFPEARVFSSPINTTGGKVI